MNSAAAGVALAVAIGLPCLTHVAAQTADMSPLLASAYPDTRLPGVPAAERSACAAVLERDASGAPRVVLAGFTSRTTGVIRLLARTARDPLGVAFDSPDAWLLQGHRCTAQVRDLDLDGAAEAFVQVQGVRAAAGWVFRWDGSALTNVTPTQSRDGRVASVLMDPLVYDLDHKAGLEVVAMRDIERLGPTQRSRHPAFVYRLDRDGLRVAGSLLAIVPYRGDTDARSSLRAFRLAEDSTGPFTLRVINGDRQGRRRVTGATIRLNEVTVAEPRDVNEATAITSIAVPTLRVQNHLTADLDGPPDATLLIVVEDATSRQ